jgi:hypothetical protein
MSVHRYSYVIYLVVGCQLQIFFSLSIFNFLTFVFVLFCLFFLLYFLGGVPIYMKKNQLFYVTLSSEFLLWNDNQINVRLDIMYWWSHMYDIENRQGKKNLKLTSDYQPLMIVRFAGTWRIHYNVTHYITSVKVSNALNYTIQFYVTLSSEFLLWNDNQINVRLDIMYWWSHMYDIAISILTHTWHNNIDSRIPFTR